jgi:hypothetical protein
MQVSLFGWRLFAQLAHDALHPVFEIVDVGEYRRHHQ